MTRAMSTASTTWRTVILLVVVMATTLTISVDASKVPPIPGPTGTVPIDWQSRVASGEMLYTPNEPLNRPEIAASVGNGFVGTLINSDDVYVSGVFNALLPNDVLSRSRRSRFPTTVRVEPIDAIAFASALDIQRGVFYRRSYIKQAREKGTCLVVMEQRWYAHRVNRELLISEFTLDASRCSADIGVSPIELFDSTGAPSADIHFRELRNGKDIPSGASLQVGSTIWPEKPGAISTGVAVMRTIVPKNIALRAGDVTIVRFISAYATTLGDTPPPPPPNNVTVYFKRTVPAEECKAADPLRIDCGSNITPSECKLGGCCYDPQLRVHNNEALPKCYFSVNVTSYVMDVYKKAIHDADSLLETHIKAWEQLVEAGIDISGNNELRGIVRASYYAILSSIRDDWPYSVSPGGLSSGGGNATGYPGQEEEGYFGHTFWDADVWVMPALLPFYVSSAQSIIDYRYERIPASETVAALYGWKGTKFAWESALIGQEECEVPNVEDHLSADISIAVRQYWRATNDKDWLKAKGFPLLVGIANFWISRVVKYEDGSYGVLDVQPPNEFVPHANNSVFTNAAAKMALEFTKEAADILKISVPPIYMDVANKMVIPFDNEFQMHLEYDGRLPNNTDPIKQADVTLLNYPLQYNMSDTVRRNDLVHEQKLVSPLGPAMTHGIFAIGYLDIGRQDPVILREANEAFSSGYALYVHPPFNVWLECPDPGCVVKINGSAVPPCPNFITGAGGFLQSLIYGFMGLRYNADSLTIEPTLPFNTTSVTLSRVAYLSSLLEITYSQSGTVLRLVGTSHSDAPKLRVQTCQGKSEDLKHNQAVTIPAACGMQVARAP